MSLRAIPEVVAAATREEIPILSLRNVPKCRVRDPTGSIMKTFLAHLAANPSETRVESSQALALDAARSAAVRDGSSRGGHRLRCKDGTDPDRARGFTLSVLHPRGSGRCRTWRAGTGPASDRPQRRARPVITDFPDLTVPEVVNAVAFVLIGAGMAWGGEQLQRNRVQAAISANDAHARVPSAD